MIGRDITFQIDKRRDPVLVSEEQTLANVILRALFLVPGQDPVFPNRGVNIRQYFNKTLDAIDVTKIQNDLVATCGEDNVAPYITDLSLASGPLEGKNTILIQIDLIINGVERLLAIAMQQAFGTQRIHINYTFTNKEAARATN